MNRLILSIALAAAALPAQTTINGGRTVTGAWDASGASSTRPVKTGTTNPANCAVGELFYRSDTASLMHCMVLNTWGSLGGSYNLPAASDTTLGGVKVGSGLSINPAGVLSTSGAGITSLVDPQYFAVREDFNNVSYPGSGSYTGLGSTWRTLCSGTGCAGVQRHGEWPNMAQLGIKTGSASGNQYYIGLQVSFNIGALYENSDKAWTMYWTFGLQQTAGMTFFAGHGQTVSSTSRPQDWFGLRYDAAAGPNFNFCFVGNNTDFACYDSGVAADTSFHTLKIRADGTSAGKVWFRLDGGTEISACASGCDIAPPATYTASYATVPFALVETGDAASKQVNLDYFGLEARVSANADRRN
jgi:hypothetical protein